MLENIEISNLRQPSKPNNHSVKLFLENILPIEMKNSKKTQEKGPRKFTRKRWIDQSVF